MNYTIKNIVDDIFLLLDIFPPKIKQYLKTHPELPTLTEVVLDLGRKPEIRFSSSAFTIPNLSEITEDEINHIAAKVGRFDTDNRAGIERTLHRISAIKNRHGKIVGLTCRVGRAIVGTIEIVRDFVESGKNILFLGKPGIGKTTKLRETARVLADDLKKRVIVIDTSNEIAGDGDICHPGIGSARRMQVPSPNRQHAVMIEAVENHMPQVIIVDEIGTQEEAMAARTIAERGVQLIATAHGHSLENLIKNPTLSDLVGGVQTVILGDEEAKIRGTQKSILERKSLPTFDCIIEIRERDVFAIYPDVKEVVDRFLRRQISNPLIRERLSDGSVKEIQAYQRTMATEMEIVEAENIEESTLLHPNIVIFPFGINRDFLAAAVNILAAPVSISDKISDATLVLSLKTRVKSMAKLNSLLQGKNLPVHVLKQNTTAEIIKFLRNVLNLSSSDLDAQEDAILEIQDICKKVVATRVALDASPRNEYLRRLQHQEVEKHNLNSASVGKEPNVRVRVYPV